MTDEMHGFEASLLSDHRDDMCACLWDPDEPPRKPTDARVSPVSDDLGHEVDLMRDTPPADVIDVDLFNL